MSFLLRVFEIAERRHNAGVNALIGLQQVGRMNLFAHILAVHLVQQALEGHDFVLLLCVDAVVEGDVANAPPGKVFLRQFARFDVVSSQPGIVFGNDEVDAPGLNVPNHALKLRPVLIQARVAIVLIDAVNAPPLLVAVVFQQLPLMSDAVAFQFVSVLL